jgi:hypothetical protein
MGSTLFYCINNTYIMVFTEPSKKIQEFLKKDVLLPDFHLSKKSSAVLQKLYQQAIDAHLLKPNYSIVSEDTTGLPKGSSYDYMEKSIRDHIEGLENRVTQVVLTVEQRVYTIFFVIPVGTASEIDNYVKWINTWLQVATLYAKPSCSKMVTVYLYLTDLKKVLPKKDGIELNQENANTAFTTSCQTNTEIILYRREEWFKVFIHESFHNLGLDFAGETVKDSLSQIFPIQSEFKLYETYTEMWAELMNIIFITVGEKTKEQKIEKLEKYIQMERKFSLFQSAKILNHFGITYRSLFEKTAEAEQMRKKYKEDTEIFCYFILKTLLMYNCNDFIEWMHDHQKPVTNKVDKFIKDLIIPRYNEIQFINTIEHMNENINLTKSTTLRMTALEQLL